MLTKAMILSADDRKLTKLDVPEWGGEIYIRTMSGAERDTLEREVMQAGGKDTRLNMDNYRARFCARVICDDKGERLFSDTEIQTLGGKSSVVLDRIVAAAQQLNALTPSDVEDIVKN